MALFMMIYIPYIAYNFVLKEPNCCKKLMKSTQLLKLFMVHVMCVMRCICKPKKLLDHPTIPQKISLNVNYGYMFLPEIVYLIRLVRLDVMIPIILLLTCYCITCDLYLPNC